MPGKLLKKVQELTTFQIEEYAKHLNKEDDVLISLGCTQRQVENCKKSQRWRKHWDIGYAQGMVDKNKEMYMSKDSTVLKLYADKVVPQTESVDIVIEWDAPKWFYEELKVDKIKSARRSV